MKMRFRLLAAISAVTFALSLGALHPQWVLKSTIRHWEVRSLSAGDFNEDGLTDFVTRTADEGVYINLTQTGGTLSTPVQVSHPGTDLGNGLVVGDVTGDGHLDVIIGDLVQPSLIILPGNGDGTFGTAIVSPLASAPTDLASTDFNEDGKLDLAVRSNPAASLAIHAGDGAGHFSLVVTLALGADAWRVATGDVDHDGFEDAAVGYYTAAPTRIYFGNGDGTFDPPVELASPGVRMSRMALADLDNDLDLEVLYCHFDTSTATVVVNGGSRTFAPAVAYSTRSGSPYDLVAADVDGDGNRDVLTPLANGRSITTLRGHGDGTLSAPYSSSANSESTDFPHLLAIADLTGDARPDLVLASELTLKVFENRAGDADVIVSSDYPTISEGQPVQFRVRVSSVAGASSAPSLVAAGTVSLKRDGVVIGTGILSANGSPITIDVASLPVGTHAITVAFPGDDNYAAKESAPLSQRVVAAVTTTTLTSNAPTVDYGTPFRLTAQVSSPLAEPLSGTIWIYRNGERLNSSISAPHGNLETNWLAPGTYQFHALYAGNANQPPSTSAAITQVVTKASTTTVIEGRPAFARFSSQHRLYLTVSSPSHSNPRSVKLYEGSTLIGSITESSGYVNVSLPIGVHYLHAVFEGDANHRPSRSALFRYEVKPDQGVYLSAYADGTTIRVQTLSNNYRNYFKLYRRIGNGEWEWFAATHGAREEVNAQPNVVYAYRVEEYTWFTDELLGASNTDIAMVIAFTDDPLTPGTPVRTAHVSELLGATNLLLAASGAPPVTLSGVTPGQPMRAQHLLTLRGAINNGRAGLGITSAQWTNIIEPGRPVRAFDIFELREALR